MSQSIRRVAICGASRIPFCRSNGAYADLSNLDMLSRALQGLVDQCNLHGKVIDEVVAGAVTTHSKDFNLTREAILSTDLSPFTPGITMQQACGTSLQAASGIMAKIASGQIECGIAAGTDTTSDAPIVFSKKFSQRLIKLPRAKTLQQKLALFKGFSPAELAPNPPQNAEPRTGLSMGGHCELMAKEWGITREEQDAMAQASHNKSEKAWDEGFFDDLTVHCEGVLRDDNLRKGLTTEQLAKLKPAFDRKSGQGTLTAGNSSTLTDGASAVLLCSEEYAKDNGLEVMAYMTYARHAAVDFVEGEGLLMGPTVAVAEMLKQANLSLQDFDFYEIHEAFAAQVLCTLKSWEDETYCTERLGLDAPLGSIDPEKLNVVGSSLAAGHPFAATGARVMGNLAKLLKEKGSGRGLISVCTAGGMGVAAILEAP